MGQQIQTALDEHDQRRNASWLSANFHLLCVPYPFEGPEFSPEELLVAKSQRLLVFPAAAVELLSSHVIFTGTAREFVIDSTVKRGAAFEWDRTLQLEPGVFVAGGGAGGRIYFQKSDTSPLNQEVVRIVRRLFSYVKGTSPLKSTGKYPRFVGASLAQKIRDGSTRLSYPNGTRIELMPNEPCKNG